MHNLLEEPTLLGIRPEIMNTLDITKPAKGEPALLTWDEGAYHVPRVQAGL